MLMVKRLESQIMYYMLLDFSHSSFVSDPADGKNCVTSRCTSNGKTKKLHFLKVYCNSTDSIVRGVCGKYCYIDWLIVFIARTIYLTWCYSLEDSRNCLNKNVDITFSAHDAFLE